MSERLLHILLVEDNLGDAVLVQEMLFDAEGAPFTLHRAESLLEGLDKLAQTGMDAILLDLNLPDSEGLETLTAMQAHAPGIPIVLLTGNDDKSLALSAVEAGAQDYLSKDKLTADALVRALRYAVVRYQNRPEPLESGSGPATCRVIALLGGKGGVGTTTVACHLAVELRRQTEHEVLLVDLDTNAGSVAFVMQIKSPYSVLDAADNVHHLDASVWRSMVSQTGDGLDVLCSPGASGTREEISAGRIVHALRFARQHYAWIVLDLGRLNPLSAKLVTSVDEVLLVTTSDVIAVHETGCVVEAMQSLEAVMNAPSLIQNQADKWSSMPDVVKAVIKLPIRAALPECREDLSEAYTKGKLAGETTPFRQSVAALAADVAGLPRKKGTAAGFSLRRLPFFHLRQPSHAE
jgi:Flp pilus assembly CpaE family ATPase